MILIQILISFTALVCLAAVVKPFGPFPTRGRAFLAFLGLCLLNGFAGLVGNTHSVRQADASAAKQQQPSHATQPATLDTNPAQSDAKESNWKYSSATDEMTGAVRNIVCTTSTNELQFDFPYSGGSTGELCFRKEGGKLNAWVQISSGQFMCGIDDCLLRLKFDNGAIQSFAAEESTTHESNFLFINSASRLLASTKGSKTLKLEAKYFQSGSKVLQFNLGGIDTSKL